MLNMVAMMTTRAIVAMGTLLSAVQELIVSSLFARALRLPSQAWFGAALSMVFSATDDGRSASHHANSQT